MQQRIFRDRTELRDRRTQCSRRVQLYVSRQTQSVNGVTHSDTTELEVLTMMMKHASKEQGTGAGDGQSGRVKGMVTDLINRMPSHKTMQSRRFRANCTAILDVSQSPRTIDSTSTRGKKANHFEHGGARCSCGGGRRRRQC